MVKLSSLATAGDSTEDFGPIPIENVNSLQMQSQTIKFIYQSICKNKTPVKFNEACTKWLESDITLIACHS